MLALKLYEYLLIIELDEQTKAKVFGIKHQFSLLGCKNAFNLVPHLTICNFLLHQNKEEKLVTRFESFIKCFSPFTVVLNGFQTFNNKTISIKVDDSDYLIFMVSKLKSTFSVFLKLSPKLNPLFCFKSSRNDSKANDRGSAQFTMGRLERQRVY
jgi:hypothetical protein